MFSEAGIEAKGREIGLSPRVGESYHCFKQRIIEAGKPQKQSALPTASTINNHNQQERQAQRQTSQVATTAIASIKEMLKIRSSSGRVA